MDEIGVAKTVLSNKLKGVIMRAPLRKEVSTVWKTMTYLLVPESVLSNAPRNVKKYVKDFFAEETLESRTYFVAFLEENFKIDSVNPKGVAPCHLLKSPGMAQWFEQKIRSGQIIRTRISWDNNEPEIIEIISRTRPY